MAVSRVTLIALLTLALGSRAGHAATAGPDFGKLPLYFVENRGQVNGDAAYLVPPSAEDVALQGAAYRCPFANGDLEPDANALANGVVLSLYQVNLVTPTLRLAKNGTTIRFRF